MNNKGFTIIELSAIVLILAIIFLISFPSILNMTRADKEKEYSTMVDNLCLAGKSYIYSNLNNYDISTINNEITIDIEDLITYGNVDSNLKNPKTKRKVNNDTLTYTVDNDYSLKCKYNES